MQCWTAASLVVFASKLDGRLLASPVESALFLDVKPNSSAARAATVRWLWRMVQAEAERRPRLSERLPSD